MRCGRLRALRKSLFKPAAFFKGILLPLAAENCTLREDGVEEF